MTECIFCRIIRGDIPSFKIYEDDEVYSFLDINPVAYGHTLVIPKKHYETIFDAQDEEYGKLGSRVATIAKKLKNVLNCDGISIMQSNEKAAGQVIFHVHFHLIPRMKNDEIFKFPEVLGEKVDFERLASKIGRG